jgi:hypothetical protein
MTQMLEINWNNFKAKFNGKEQKSFEHLSYLLFCDEHNKETGIFRYKNQTGIETEPIKYHDKWVGFQSKFYETKISGNKEDIKDSITKAKTKNPNLNKILFYINQEFSESSKKNRKEPEYKIEIENHAKAKKVEIEWKVPSHFERQLALDKNLTLAQHFFSLGKSVIDFICELNQHTESILTPIHSEIQFNVNEIKIDRTSVINKLKATLDKSSLVIVSGEGGVGKTAVIKDFYNNIKDTTPFFVFKATEFNISNINGLFKNYGSFTLSDFISEHQDIEAKYIVIDSAEKLSEIEHQETFQEFLSALLKYKWKIIFTTRYSYLDDLKFQFIEVYQLSFQLINIERLNNTELAELSKKYGFNLPDNERLLELIQNLFYLNEYLLNHPSINKTTTYSDFRNILWNKKISKSSYRRNNTHIRREECFLRIAQKRANDGHLFVKGDSCDNEILQKLGADEIIKYDSNAGGYFITQDIYEEWALDKIIEREFHNSHEYESLFNSLGSSLPIRRAFRNWLSKKLLNSQDEVKSFIEESFTNDRIEAFWRDELLVSVLLSDYSKVFFQIFEKKLLEDNQKLLMRIVFLLRIACKRIDESLLNILGFQKTVGITLKTLFNKPKGSGWECAIDFIHKHINDFGLQNINIILPLLDDWNNKIKDGKTTKQASQIALYYYEEIITNRDYRYGFRSEQKEQLVKVVLHGASEIKDELKVIFDEVIREKKTSYRDKYYELIHTILTSIIDSFEVVKSLPKEVIKLAEQSWFQVPNDEYRYSIMAVEDSFCISSSRQDYFPESALQTPVFNLLRFAPKETIDFILSFTNKTVEYHSKSKSKNEVEEVEVVFNEKETIKQYISNRLWNMYRGTQVCPHLLASIHMALEKWMLEYAKSAPKEKLDSLCIYLIRNSKSASITAVVVSVVLANFSELFNVAKILFQTKEFFLYDTRRMSLDLHHKSQLLSLKNNFPSNYKNEIYDEERIKACDDAHRKSSLENITLNYQFVRLKEESDNDVKIRQQVMWNIFDEYYGKLPDKAKETESDKTWRLYLARMDRRKMHPELEKKDEHVLVHLNPEMDPELKKYSEDSLQKSAEPMKYSALHVWSYYRYSNEEDKYKQYQQYENNPQLVIKETKEIIKGLKKNTEESYFLFNHSIPAYTCSVLIRDFFDKLNKKEKEFCKEVIIDFASLPLQVENYQYQVSDGTGPTITLLPEILKHFPKDKGIIKSTLFSLLLNPWREISTFAISSVLHNLWKISFDDAQSIFLGYLFLKPKYDEVSGKVRNENIQKKIYETSVKQVLETFIRQYLNELQRIISNKIKYEDLDELEQLDLEILKTAFELLPYKTKNEDHKDFLKIIFPIFSKKLFIDDDDEVDYTLKNRFFNKFACFILTSTKEEIETYIKPFVDNFSNSRDMAGFFQEFISVEDSLNQYEEFWLVWNAFYGKIVETCKNKSSYYYTKEIVHNYLLAWPYWKEDAKKWHTLKEREKSFFKKVAEDIGHHPSVLYSLSKILNDIGSNFLEDGILWISGILKKNDNLFTDELEVNTIFYIETIARRYTLTNHHKIRTTRRIKENVIVILNFLIERGSVTGYLSREAIL